MTYIKEHIDRISEHFKDINDEFGWCVDPSTGEAYTREALIGDVGRMNTSLLLIVSEVLEGFDGYRKNLMDDKLPQYDNLTVELADTVIRSLELMARLTDSPGQVIQDKINFNLNRDDHKKENRDKKNGKKF